MSFKGIITLTEINKDSSGKRSEGQSSVWELFSPHNLTYMKEVIVLFTSMQILFITFNYAQYTTILGVSFCLSTVDGFLLVTILSCLIKSSWHTITQLNTQTKVQLAVTFICD